MPEQRILIITDRVPYPLNDGGAMAMDAMIRGYHDQGWKVYLLCMNTTRHPVADEVVKRLYPQIYKVETVAIDNSIKPLQLLNNYLFSTLPNHAVRFFHKSFADKVEQVVRQYEPDVVQLESTYLSTYLTCIRNAGKAKLVLRMHNIEHQIWRRYAEEVKNIFKKIYVSNLAKRIEAFEYKIWGEYDLLLPITAVDAQVVLNSRLQQHIVVAPVGIDIVPERSDVAQKWAAYHIGAMDWLPNQEAIDWLLKDIWPVVHHAIPDFTFYYAGRNMPDSYKQLNIEGVVCAGEVPDAAKFMADKRILLVPLRSGGGIRVKILEGMAAGKVVISTDVGMQGIEATKGVHYLAANTPHEFAEAIKWCFNNKQQAEQIAAAAVTLVSTRYNREHIMSEITTYMRKKLF
jgi:polysaccharide biosynthesis protein PslH